MTTRKAKELLTTGTLASLLACGAQAQSADALIDKLVEKGILTVKEANALREEADKNFAQAYSIKSGMPDWVASLKVSGDVRARYESFFTDANYQPSTGAESDFVTRNRFRYRLRFGATATLFENFEVGLRLTSSEPAGNFGGDPVSGNTTFRDNASKKFIYIDQAYGRWNFLNGPEFSGTVTLGKMDTPFVFTDMVFDPDYTPEGASVQTSYRLSSEHSLKLNSGAFMLDELAGSSNDPYLLGVQLRWDAAWSKKVATTAGIGALTIQNEEKLATSEVPNQGAGNTRRADGTLVEDFNPIVADAGVTYTLESFPYYKGSFPIRVAGEYMHNPGASSQSDNYSWNLGVVFGKSGKRGTWDISYAYRWMGANVWWEELVDSDFGAFYARTTTFPGSGANAGYASGTNVKGHIVRFSYSPTDAMTLSAKWFLTELINPFPEEADSQMNRLQVDASLKF